MDEQKRQKMERTLGAALELEASLNLKIRVLRHAYETLGRTFNTRRILRELEKHKAEVEHTIHTARLILKYPRWPAPGRYRVEAKPCVQRVPTRIPDAMPKTIDYDERRIRPGCPSNELRD